MIRHCTFFNSGENVNMNPGMGKTPIYVNPWEIYAKLLEAGDDTLIWVVTRKQYGDFMTKVKKYGLEKYLVQRHNCTGPISDEDGYIYAYKEEEGVSNHNYQNDPKKLKIFVMKGAKA